MRFSVQSRIFVKVYGFLFFAKNIGNNVGKSIGKNVSVKCCQRHLDHSK